MLDEAAMDRVASKHTYFACIHFAGLKAVGESVSKPVWYYHNNITGTLNLVKAMTKAGCKRIVFSSSATVYGRYLPVLCLRVGWCPPARARPSHRPVLPTPAPRRQ